MIAIIVPQIHAVSKGQTHPLVWEEAAKFSILFHIVEIRAFLHTPSAILHTNQFYPEPAAVKISARPSAFPPRQATSVPLGPFSAE